MRDEIKEEVERQLRERDVLRSRTRVFRFVLLSVLLSAFLVWAQQGPAGVGGAHQMADLFKRFFTWSGTADIQAIGAVQTTSTQIYAIGYSDSVSTNSFCFGGMSTDGTTCTRGALEYSNASTVITATQGGSLGTLQAATFTSGQASGSNAFTTQQNGARSDFGTGTDDFIASNGTNIFVGTSPGAGYVASAIPISIGVAYVNNTIAAFTYGGSKLPAHAATITDIGYNIRVAGTGGSTNNTFQISDGTNTCNCTFACNQATGSQIASCANGAGTGCVYAASAALTFGFSAVGDCTGATDVLGNINVRGKWQ